MTMGRMTRVLVLVAALATALAMVVTAAPTATAKRDVVSDSNQRGLAAPATEVRLDGRGYGHGKGLSQYGALGRAKAGHSYRKIVNFYYPRTRWNRIGGKVRVLITADTSRDVVVRAQRGLTITALKSGRSWMPRKARADKWRIDSTRSGRTVVSYRTGRWHRWRDFPGEAQFSGGGPITLFTGSGTVSYRGVLRSAAPGTGRDRDTVNIVSLEDYLKGVVPREVPALWPGAAVRAQSVAARTYAAFERAAAPNGRHWQICDTAHCQVYGGHSAEHSASNAAIRATRKQALTKHGRPAFTQFSASNGGWSVDGGYPYLPAQRDRKDRGHEYAAWSVTVPADAVDRHWPTIGELESIRVDRRDGNGEWGGRVLEMTITGDQGSATVSGDTFRSYLGLRSSWFDPTVR